MPPRHRVPRQVRLRRTILVTTAILLATAFGIYYSMQGPAPLSRPATEPQHGAPSPTSSLPPLPRLRVAIPVPVWTMLATLRGPVPGYSGPSAVGPARIVAPTWGAAATLPVVARRTHWLEVRVIGRPNGQTAWIPAADVAPTRTPYYIVVDLSRKHLFLFWKGKLRLYAPVGVGARPTPTPVGQYFIALFTRSPNPGYGPFVIVTSGLASTVTDWEEDGTPVITLNGPLDSTTLIAPHGAAVSPESVRVLDSDLQQLRPVPAGTPIDVVPTITPQRP